MTSPSDRCRLRRPAGFTLIEMLVALGILAMVAVVALPRLAGPRERAQFAVATREIAAALRETRSLAVLQGRPAVLVVDTVGATYRVGSAAPPHRFPVGIRPVLFTTTGQVLGETVGTIRFFPDGSSTGGGVRLVAGDRRRDVLVDWLSGRVSTQ